MKTTLICILLSIFLVGCATKTEIKYVYVPTKCEVDMPPRPTTSKYDAFYLKEVLIYTEKLENIIEFCRNGVKETK